MSQRMRTVQDGAQLVGNGGPVSASQFGRGESTGPYWGFCRMGGTGSVGTLSQLGIGSFDGGGCGLAWALAGGG